MAGRKRLGEMLLESGVIDQNQLDAALGHQRKWGGRLGQALVDLKLTSEARVVEALSRKFGYEVVGVSGLEAGPTLEAALKLVPREAASRHNVLPYAADTSSVSVAMSDPGNIVVVDEIRFRTGRRVKVALAGDREIAAAVRRFYYPGESEPAAISLDVEDDDSGTTGAVQPGGGSTNALDEFFAGPAAGTARPGVGAPPGGAIDLEDSPGARPRAAAETAARGRPPAPASPGLARAAAPASPAPATRAAASSPAARSAAPSPAGTAPHGEEPAGKSGTVELPLDAEIPPDAEGEDLWSQGPVKAPTPPPAAAPQPAAPPLAAARPATAPPAAAGRSSTGRELEVLEAIDQLAHGEPAVPELVKPSQLAAALLRLLVRKKVVTFEELLEELGRK